ncbi:hypothetical protein [Leucobacter chromiiresistens]|uniref:Uncharacterized protein n=1 Tax=Leucobacter chromiiresistens TaxID=1079994 RepID=A0A1H0ZYK0_9MICO|nr:hypothetical protein [Leucobacter chromiiresistens]SDQ32517.1 hypothetical protein SAMN04488565_2182 [Leucobacter chromiiresistens]
MGRVLRREVIAIKCEVRSCDATDPLFPSIPQETTWHDHAAQLTELVAQGWSIVLTPKFRTYCPEHAERARDCTCRTNPSRRHLCVVHTLEAAELIWDADQTPIEVSAFLEVVS